jgi:hypothetical protein
MFRYSSKKFSHVVALDATYCSAHGSCAFLIAREISVAFTFEVGSTFNTSFASLDWPREKLPTGLPTSALGAVTCRNFCMLCFRDCHPLFSILKRVLWLVEIMVVIPIVHAEASNAAAASRAFLNHIYAIRQNTVLRPEFRVAVVRGSSGVRSRVIAISGGAQEPVMAVGSVRCKFDMRRQNKADV